MTKRKHSTTYLYNEKSMQYLWYCIEDLDVEVREPDSLYVYTDWVI